MNLIKNFSEVSLRSLSLAFEEYLYVRESNSELIFEKCKSEFEEEIEFYKTLDGS